MTDVGTMQMVAETTLKANIAGIISNIISWIAIIFTIIWGFASWYNDRIKGLINYFSWLVGFVVAATLEILLEDKKIHVVLELIIVIGSLYFIIFVIRPLLIRIVEKKENKKNLNWIGYKNRKK